MRKLLQIKETKKNSSQMKGTNKLNVHMEIGLIYFDPKKRSSLIRREKKYVNTL